MIRFPRFSLTAEVSVVFLRRVLDQLNKLLSTLEQTISYNVTTITADETLLGGPRHVARLVDSTSGNVTITLPPAEESLDMRLEVKKLVAANSVTIAGAGSDTIDGVASISFTTQYMSYTIVCFEGAWYVI